MAALSIMYGGGKRIQSSSASMHRFKNLRPSAVIPTTINNRWKEENRKQ